MKKNVGTLDMLIRIAAGVVLLYIGFSDNSVVAPGLSKTLMGYFGFVPILTGSLRYCPLYTPAGINTRGTK